VVVAAFQAEGVGFDEDFGGGVACGGFEFVAGELDFEAVAVVEIDGVHEAAVAIDEIDAEGAEAFGGESEGGAGDVEGDVLDAAGIAGGFAAGIGAGLIGEDGEEAAVAGVEVEVVLVGLAEVGLLEDEGHAEDALPEIDGALFGGSDKGDVVEALDGDSGHEVMLLHILHLDVAFGGAAVVVDDADEVSAVG